MQSDASSAAANDNQPKALSREEQNKAAALRDTRRSELTSRFGERAEAIIAGEVQMDMTKEEVLETSGNPRRKDSLPPKYELWVYDSFRIAFTDGRVTHVGH